MTKYSTLHARECTVIAPQRDPDILRCQDKDIESYSINLLFMLNNLLLLYGDS